MMIIASYYPGVIHTHFIIPLLTRWCGHRWKRPTHVWSSWSVSWRRQRRKPHELTLHAGNCRGSLTTPPRPARAWAVRFTHWRTASGMWQQARKTLFQHFFEAEAKENTVRCSQNEIFSKWVVSLKEEFNDFQCSIVVEWLELVLEGSGRIIGRLRNTLKVTQE